MAEQQRTLFSDDTPTLNEPEASIERVAEGNEDWIDLVLSVIEGYDPGFCFTTDRLWWEVRREPRPRDPRAMGAVTRTARSRDLIEKTGEYHTSVRPECHKRPVPVWRRK